MRRLLIFSLTIAVLGLFSCENYENETEIETKTETPEVLVNGSAVGSLSGVVFETVHVNSTRNSTIKNGLFYFSEQKLNAFGQAIVLEESQNVISFFPLLKNTAYIQHEDLRERTESTVDGSKEINSTLTNGVKIQINKNSLKTSSDQYSGPVNILWADLDLNEKSSWASFPAQVSAVNKKGERGMLKLDEVFQLGLHSDSDELLDLSDNKSLEIDLSNHANLSNIDGSSDLWHFDIEKSVWNLLDTKSNGFSTINLEKIGYFAFGSYANSVNITGELFSLDAPIHNLEIVIKNSAGDIIQTSRSGSKGILNIYTPDVAAGSMEVYSQCGLVHSQALNITGESISLGRISIGSAEEFMIITGELLNCNNQQEEGASLYWNYAGQSGIYHLPNGEFSIAFPYCENQEDLRTTGINLSTGEEGGEVNWTIGVGTDTVLLKPLYYCSSSQGEYVSMKMDGSTMTVWMGESTIVNNRLVLGYDEQGENMELYLSDHFQGEIDLESINIKFDLPNIGDGGYSLNCPSSELGCGFERFIITQYPQSQGEWIRGYFEGTFWVRRLGRNAATYRKIEGSFQIFRDY